MLSAASILSHSQETISISKKKAQIAAELIERGKGYYKEAKILRRERDSLYLYIGELRARIRNGDKLEANLMDQIRTDSTLIALKDEQIKEYIKQGNFYRRKYRAQVWKTRIIVVAVILERTLIRKWLRY